MRRRLIAGNWKMNGTVADSLKIVSRLSNELKATGQIDVVIIPPFTTLYSTGIALTETEFHLGAQNLYWEDSGAYTGEISGDLLREIGCKFVVVGHSERRQLFGETNETVNKRLIAAIRNDLIPIMCVGETLAERDAGKTWAVVESQLSFGLRGINIATCEDFIIAYEPVWAIGTGKNASPEQAEEVHWLIRKYLAESFGNGVAEKTRILYGGSVKPSNSRHLLVQKNIDGALVGGASLDAMQFADIIRSAH